MAQQGTYVSYQVDESKSSWPATNLSSQTAHVFKVHMHLHLFFSEVSAQFSAFLSIVSGKEPCF